MKLLQYSDDFEELYAKGIIKKQKAALIFKVALSETEFTINEKVIEAILNNNPLPNLEDDVATDIIEFLAKISKYMTKI
jgi:hypothetical protein